MSYVKSIQICKCQKHKNMYNNHNSRKSLQQACCLGSSDLKWSFRKKRELQSVGNEKSWLNGGKALECRSQKVKNTGCCVGVEKSALFRTVCSILQSMFYSEWVLRGICALRTEHRRKASFCCTHINWRIACFVSIAQIRKLIPQKRELQLVAG